MWRELKRTGCRVSAGRESQGGQDGICKNERLGGSPRSGAGAALVVVPDEALEGVVGAALSPEVNARKLGQRTIQHRVGIVDFPLQISYGMSLATEGGRGVKRCLFDLWEFPKRQLFKKTLLSYEKVMFRKLSACYKLHRFV